MFLCSTITIKSSYYHPRKSTKKVRVVGAEPKVHEELLQQRSLIGEQPGCTVPEDFHHGDGGGDVDGDVDGDIDRDDDDVDGESDDVDDDDDDEHD